MTTQQIRFHVPLIPSITYLGGTVRENMPVNMGLVEAISKSRMRWYPDNEGKPSILFHGTKVEWAFDTEEDRDCEYARIMHKFA
ncbi:hypothetical protein ABID82_007172 [Methylobacterium sp. PvP062]|uniref:Uncharacterized protein n=1 Tax=Methylobacterium radiotolerans TaxID=31998 RepID=A0ABV2NP81_9HYPH|nr:hypothetical protein [Methylobacterium sp. PvP105]MBP2505162.1 hypothetical protein [Methylobacterium sp. PvP109]